VVRSLGSNIRSTGAVLTASLRVKNADSYSWVQEKGTPSPSSAANGRQIVAKLAIY
jgi:hypothetical protein